MIQQAIATLLVHDQCQSNSVECSGFVQMPTALLLRKHVSKQQNTLAGESGCCSSEGKNTDKAASIHSQVADNTDKAANEQQHSLPDVLQPAKQSMQNQKTRVTCQLLCFFFMFMLVLLLLSEMQLRHHQEHFTMSTLGSLGSSQASKQQILPLGASKCQHWTQHVYGYMLTVRCVAPPKALSSLLEMCLMHAGSRLNTQHWHVVVLLCRGLS